MDLRPRVDRFEAAGRPPGARGASLPRAARNGKAGRAPERHTRGRDGPAGLPLAAICHPAPHGASRAGPNEDTGARLR